MASEHSVARSLAPWKTKAESYLLLTRLRELPADGVYDECEAAWASEDVGGFKGGLGGVMIVRYTDTPVGPYDELMFLPGPFAVPTHPTTPPTTPSSALRITRIYVSQRTTTYNGRLNWNIPKHLARFSFSAPPTPAGATPPPSLSISVFPPDTTENDGTPPFFQAKLTPFTYLPAIPVSSAYLPLSTLIVQPPLPAAPAHQAAEHRAAETPLMVGTQQWCAFEIGARIARARGCWVEVKEPGTEMEVSEASKWFPQRLGAWSVGAWCEEGVLEIPEPVVWKL